MCGVTCEDRIRKKYIRGSIGAASIAENMRENRLRCFGNGIRYKET